MKTIWKLALCSLIVSVMAAGSTFAEKGDGEKKGKGKKSPIKMFEKLDTDGNGSLSLEEFTAGHEKRMEKRKERQAEKGGEKSGRTPPPANEIFEKMDSDGSGEVSLEEFVTHVNSRKAKRQGRKKDVAE